MPRSGIELSPGVELDSDEVLEALFERMDVTASRAALSLLIRSVESLGTVASGIQANAQFLLDHLAALSSAAEEGELREQGRESHDDHGT